MPLSEIVAPTTPWRSAETRQPDPLAAPLGVEVRDLEPLIVDLASCPNALIAGPAQSGKTTLLRTWLLALAQQLDPTQLQLYLLDSRRRGLAVLRALPQVQGYACEEDAAREILIGLLELANKRRQPSEGAAVAMRPAVVIALGDCFDSLDDVTSSEDKDRLATLLRVGRSAGMHLLLAGASNDLGSNGWNEPIKTLKTAQVGLMLGISDDSVFNLRLPYGERDQIMPPGEGYWTQRGRSLRVKLATPQAGSVSLADWVERLRQRARPTPNPKA